MSSILHTPFKLPSHKPSHTLPYSSIPFHTLTHPHPPSHLLTYFSPTLSHSLFCILCISSQQCSSIRSSFNHCWLFHHRIKYNSRQWYPRLDTHRSSYLCIFFLRSSRCHCWDCCCGYRWTCRHIYAYHVGDTMEKYLSIILWRMLEMDKIWQTNATKFLTIFLTIIVWR